MTMQTTNRSVAGVDGFKQQARRLREALGAGGAAISHGRALELVARQHGCRDWNTLAAMAGSARTASACPVSLGERVSGHYLGQAFDGEIVGTQQLSRPDRFRVSIAFDRPVDVVTFDSFSAYRRRVSCVIDSKGVTAQKTSDGEPHLRLRLAA